MPPKGNWSQQWPILAAPIVASVTTAQREAASTAPPYVASLLAETGVTAAAGKANSTAAQGAVNALSLAGIASDGRPLESLLYGAVVHAGEHFNAGASPMLALTQGQKWLMEAIETQILDAARVADEIETAARPWLRGYVRMIEPGACSRCIVLAGRFYRWNDGFLRHPGCRCVHIPAMEEGARFGTESTNPNKYFDSLSRAEQDKAFGKAGAEAVRLGADISQVVNARRGMTFAGEAQTTTRVINGREFTVNVRHRTAQTTMLHGQPTLLTTEGITKRGFYGGGHGGSKPGGHSAYNVGQRGYVKNYTERRAKRARLMPETILQIADDRDDAIRLLRLYGYLT